VLKEKKMEKLTCDASLCGMYARLRHMTKRDS